MHRCITYNNTLFWRMQIIAEQSRPFCGPTLSFLLRCSGYCITKQYFIILVQHAPGRSKDPGQIPLCPHKKGAELGLSIIDIAARMLVGEFPKIRDPNIGPQIVGLLLTTPTKKDPQLLEAAMLQGHVIRLRTRVKPDASSCYHHAKGHKCILRPKGLLRIRVRL